MKLTIERSVLLKSLGHVQSVVERRNTIPILSNVKLDATPDGLKLNATDMDLEIVETAEAQVQDTGATTAPAHTLHDIVRKLPDGSQVELTYSAEDSQLALRSGRSRFSLSCLPVEDFPAMVGGEFSHSFSVSANNMRALIDRTRFAISTEETRFYLNGIYLHATKSEGVDVLRAVATDGHRLARFEVPLPEGAGGMPGVIVPRKTVGELRKLIDETGMDIAISLSETKIRFGFDQAVLTSKLIDGTFPDYERVIPTENDKVMEVDRKLIADAVDRVSAISSEKSRAIKISMEKGMVTLSASSPDAGSAVEEVEASFDTGPLEIGFNSRYLMDILAQIEGEAARFDMGRRRQPDRNPRSQRQSGDLCPDAHAGVTGRRLRDDPRLILAPGDTLGSGDGVLSLGRERIGVTRLTLTDFRSYSHLRLEADLRSVILTGANGAGKTNLLEALSFLAPGRGLRRAKLSEVTREGAAGGPRGAWAVAARVHGPLGDVTIGTGREAGVSDRRTVHIDGETARSQSRLGEFVTALWLTPDMDRLFQEGAAARRRFLDRMVYGLDPDHASRLNAYETAMRNRNRLLREGRMDRAWLDGLEDSMARHGVAVAAARRDLIQRLGVALTKAEGPFPRAEVALDGVVESWLDAMPALEAEDRLRALFAANRRRDADAGVTTEGLHRTDLKVRHAGKNVAAERCSTGEQKAVLISLVLAQASVQADLRGMPPILLLDEVAAHLDDARRRALFDRLAALGAQSWLTGTDQALFAGFGDRAQHFTVRDGAAVATPLH